MEQRPFENIEGGTGFSKYWEEGACFCLCTKFPSLIRAVLINHFSDMDEKVSTKKLHYDPITMAVAVDVSCSALLNT